MMVDEFGASDHLVYFFASVGQDGRLLFWKFNPREFETEEMVCLGIQN